MLIVQLLIVTTTITYLHKLTILIRVNSIFKTYRVEFLFWNGYNILLRQWHNRLHTLRGTDVYSCVFAYIHIFNSVWLFVFNWFTTFRRKGVNINIWNNGTRTGKQQLVVNCWIYDSVLYIKKNFIKWHTMYR